MRLDLDVMKSSRARKFIKRALSRYIYIQLLFRSLLGSKQIQLSFDRGCSCHDMAGVPFKVCIADRGNLTVGVVARSYEHFCSVLKTRLGLASDYSVRLDDGTLICDEDYFHLLEPQTKLTVTSTLTRLPAWKESDYTRHNSCLTWNGSGSTNGIVL